MNRKCTHSGDIAVANATRPFGIWLPRVNWVNQASSNLSEKYSMPEVSAFLGNDYYFNRQPPKKMSKNTAKYFYLNTVYCCCCFAK